MDGERGMRCRVVFLGVWLVELVDVMVDVLWMGLVVVSCLVCTL